MSGLRQLIAGVLGLVPCLACAQLVGVTCTVSTTPVAFGQYDPGSGASDDSSSGSVMVNCTSGLLSGGTETVSIDLSAGVGGSFATRAMAGPGAVRLHYNLFSDANHTAVWGDGTGGAAAVGASVVLTGGVLGLGAAGSTTVPIYARIPAGQAVDAGAYADSIAVTVTY